MCACTHMCVKGFGPLEARVGLLQSRLGPRMSRSVLLCVAQLSESLLSLPELLSLVSRPAWLSSTLCPSSMVLTGDEDLQPEPG